MAWTGKDRRKYAPAVQEVMRQGMLARLARTMDTIDPQAKVGRQRVWSTTLMRLDVVGQLDLQGGRYTLPTAEAELISSASSASRSVRRQSRKT
jgi:hypothetical protein